jgi:diketogulonate reductase-like aldo/keto reductase
LVEDLSSFSVPAKPVATSVIIGAKRMDELQENLAAAEFVLSADEMNQLDEVSAIPEEYLNWVVSFASQNRLEVAPRS